MKKSSGSKWPFILLFVFLAVAIWAFFSYGIDYLATFIGIFNGGNDEETIVTKDNIPPAPPVIETLPEATNSAILDIVGQAEVSSQLSLFLNGEIIKEVVIGESGDFMVNGISLEEGENSVYATAKDLSGNQSQESVRQTITLDKEPPTLEIISPTDGQVFSDESAEIVIEGNTEDDSIITVNERKVIVDLDGHFEASYSLADGDNAIIILAKDRAGNQTKEELTVSYNPY